MREEEIYKLIGYRIRLIRVRKNMTQGELSQHLPLSRAALSNIELGKHRIQLHNLYELADVLGVTIYDLIV